MTKEIPMVIDCFYEAEVLKEQELMKKDVLRFMRFFCITS